MPITRFSGEKLVGVGFPQPYVNLTLEMTSMKRGTYNKLVKTHSFVKMNHKYGTQNGRS